jgi:hypothetical protein
MGVAVATWLPLRWWYGQPVWPLHKEQTMNILRLMNQSDYIQVNNQLVKPEFMYASEDYADDDDIALEAHLSEADIVLTVADLEDATPLADGAYWIESVGYIRFLSRQALH